MGDNREVIAMWTVFLAEMDDQTLGLATMMYIKQPTPGAKFWPQPHQLVAMVTPQALDADAACGLALKLIGRFGRYNLPKADDEFHEDPDVNACMKAGIASLGGFLALCNSEGEGWRHPFRRAYDAEMSRRTQSSTALRSIGAVARRQIGQAK